MVTIDDWAVLIFPTKSPTPLTVALSSQSAINAQAGRSLPRGAERDLPVVGMAIPSLACPER